ncbi:histidinol-phosphate transaminase [uncultured Tateyamaria sp.]|uniref:pyridoxal phosphate-dependent aminotransferase n=1 Tax=uncultured Tateyamaria sp. TaxID=455651 RepID=UPI002629EC28|nr:histidinol-phosphate transaminase [uncultured Tateyamaria sp.]
MIAPVKHIAAMSPYALAKLDAPGGKRLISLSQNESLRPPSPCVAEAVSNTLASAHLYPDPNWGDVRTALSGLHGIPADRILCGNGSMELIACLTQVFADDQNAVLAPAHAYPFFRTATLMARARYDTAPEKGGYVCVDALLDAVRADTRIVFVANPGNPTGTRIPRADLLCLRAGLRGDILLVIDEAYGEFADGFREPMFDLVERGDTVILRTLSKAYGLAGLRVGWGLFPPRIANEVRKVMNPNNVSIVGQAAAAAVLRDQPYMLETCEMTCQLRDGFIQRLRASGFDVADSFTNFALIRFGDAMSAQRADAALRAEGVVVRAQAGVGLPECLRVTVAAAEHLNHAADSLVRWAEGEKP